MLLILAVILLLFRTRLPTLALGIGQSMQTLKKESATTNADRADFHARPRRGRTEYRPPSQEHDQVLTMKRARHQITSTRRAILAIMLARPAPVLASSSPRMAGPTGSNTVG